MINEIYELPTNLKAYEVLNVTRSTTNSKFSFVWKRNGNLYGCKNVMIHLAMPIIFKLKDEIAKRINIEDRIEYWECYDANGNYSIEIEKQLLSVRCK